MEELNNNEGKSKRKSTKKNLNNDGKATEFFSAIDDELTENSENKISEVEENTKPVAPKAKPMHLKNKLGLVGTTTEREGGFCEINKATKFLFCRKTCLCIGAN
uniref:Uncharacterized protein n=1 Tax=Meloidogyne floridensis TaxID=298350 RepID=A0A915NWW9_9BILA